MTKRIGVDLFKLKSFDKMTEIHDKYQEFFHSLTNNMWAKIHECPICKSPGKKSAFFYKDFFYVSCTSCNSVYNSPAPTKEILDVTYKLGLYGDYQKDLVEPATDFRVSVTERRKAKQVKDLFKKDKIRVLDVGFGKGNFLKACQEEGGFELYGVEPFDKLPSGLPEGTYINKFFEKVDTDKLGGFDCISFWGVLEHMQDPMDSLKVANRLLNPGGIVIFEVPSSDSALLKTVKTFGHWKQLLLRCVENGRHLFFFSKKSIKEFAKDEGFEVALFESNGLDIQTLFANKLKSSVLLNSIAVRAQVVLDKLGLGDHLRVGLRKKKDEDSSDTSQAR